MNATKDTYFIGHNNAGIIHHGFAEKGKAMDIGQPEKEYFDTESQYLARLKELGVEPESDETE